MSLQIHQCSYVKNSPQAQVSEPLITCSTSRVHRRSYQIHSNSWREKRLNDPNLRPHPSNEKNTCSIQLASSGLMNMKILLSMSTKSKLVHYAKWRLNCDMYLQEKQNVTSFACSVGKNENKFESINSLPYAIGKHPSSLSAGFLWDSIGSTDINPHLYGHANIQHWHTQCQCTEERRSVPAGIKCSTQ